MTFEQLQEIIPGAKAEDWTQHANGGGWIKNTAKCSPACYINEWATVGGGATVGEGAIFAVSPLYIRGTMHPLCVSDYGKIQIGCTERPLAWWRKHGKAAARQNDYTEAQAQEYESYIDVAERWMKIHNMLIRPE